LPRLERSGAGRTTYRLELDRRRTYSREENPISRREANFGREDKGEVKSTEGSASMFRVYPFKKANAKGRKNDSETTRRPSSRIQNNSLLSKVTHLLGEGMKL